MASDRRSDDIDALLFWGADTGAVPRVLLAYTDFATVQSSRAPLRRDDSFWGIDV